MGAGALLLAWLLQRDVEPPGQSDVIMLSSYVGAFAVGGAITGAVHAIWQSRIAITIALMAGGALVMNTIAFVDPDGRYDRNTALWMTGMGCAFGLAGAYGWFRTSHT